MARLLIVDGHRTWVEVLAQALSQVGHEVVGHCWSADQVLPAAETDHDVVLMNLDLPSDINAAPLVGLALTEALRVCEEKGSVAGAARARILWEASTQRT